MSLRALAPLLLFLSLLPPRPAVAEDAAARSMPPFLRPFTGYWHGYIGTHQRMDRVRTHHFYKITEDRILHVQRWDGAEFKAYDPGFIMRWKLLLPSNGAFGTVSPGGLAPREGWRTLPMRIFAPRDEIRTVPHAALAPLESWRTRPARDIYFQIAVRGTRCAGNKDNPVGVGRTFYKNPHVIEKSIVRDVYLIKVTVDEGGVAHLLPRGLNDSALGKNTIKDAALAAVPVATMTESIKVLPGSVPPAARRALAWLETHPENPCGPLAQPAPSR